MTASSDGRASADPQEVKAAEPDDPLDRAHFEELRMLDRTGPGDRLAHVVTVFGNDTRACLAELRRAAEAGDSAAVERLAHTLRGSSANLAARRLPGLCAELERRAAAGGVAELSGLLLEMEAESERVSSALGAQLLRGN